MNFMFFVWQPLLTVIDCFLLWFYDFFTIKVFDHNNALLLHLECLVVIIQLIAVK